MTLSGVAEAAAAPRAAQSTAARLAAWVSGGSNRSAWRRRGTAVALGVVAAGALPPLYLVPLLVPAFTGLIWLIDTAPSRKAAFGAGWWFGFGHFASGLYWMALPLTLDIARFGWMIPFAVFGIGGALAVYVGLVTLATRLTGLTGPARILAFAAAWGGAEWLRGHLFTGFPWNLTASVWAAFPEMMQLAALVGAYGLSLVTIMIAAMPAILGDAPRDGRRTGVRNGAWLGGAAVLLALLWLGGAARVPSAPAPRWPDVRLRLVQGNVAQRLKWSRGLAQRHLSRYLQLTRSSGFARVTHVIWPETATVFWLSVDPKTRRQIGAVAPPNGAVLTGAVRVNQARDTFWNSLHVIDGAGDIVANYDKHHLVPFGEYVPLRSIFSFAKVTQGRTDFTPGPGPRTLRAAGLPPFSPLVCYEAIFPTAVLNPSDRPAWLLNVTNDAWFGTSSGPYQHLASARLRAVEEGLPLVRVANTGVSAVTDGYGRIIKRLGLNREGVIDVGLPRPVPGRTFYARFGDLTLLALIAVIGLFAFSARRH